jgi:hypothetical protein
MRLKFHADGELKKRGKRKEKNCAARSAVLLSIEKMRGRLFKCTMYYGTIIS